MIVSLVHPNGVERLRTILKEALKLGGDVAECGVYKGGTAEVEAKEMVGLGRRLLLFDTFCGMPDIKLVDDDSHRPHDMNDVNLDELKNVMTPFGFVDIYPGKFEDTVKKAIDGMSFCFVHIDADLYTSVKECCEYFYDRMVPGGIMLFDDYGSPTCKGARRAVDEFFAGKPEKIEDAGSSGPVFVRKK